MTEERLARLSVSSFPLFGSRSLRKIKDAFPSFKDAWTSSLASLVHAGITEQAATRFLEWRRSFDAQALLTTCAKEQITVVFPGDDLYPIGFQSSSDAPEVLFVRGDFGQATQKPCIAVVGTRKITPYGKQCIERIIPDLVQAGCTIVSGLALGVDGAVHQATINASGMTIAILGTGVDEASLYPREHVRLAHDMLDKGGAIISEFPLGSEGRKEHFPMRNRLIASLSLATLVIEAAPQSGSLITAKLALEENRQVLAVPGPIWSEQSAGTNQLLKLGAHVCTGAEDVLNVLALDRPDLDLQARAAFPLDPTEQRLLDLLTDPKHVDELGRLAELDPAQVNAILSVLEIKGLVKPIGGMMWVKGNMSS
ncbi:MAG: DNA-processing protein DprA [Patescibacteria group bacterium]